MLPPTPLLSRNLTSPPLMTTKAALFVLITLLAGLPLVLWPLEIHPLSRAALYFTGCWALARAYYFAFYVITNYIDPTFRYSGLTSALRWLIRPRD